MITCVNEFKIYEAAKKNKTQGKDLVIVDVQKSFADNYSNEYLIALNKYAEGFSRVFQIWDSTDNKKPDYIFKNQTGIYSKNYGSSLEIEDVDRYFAPQQRDYILQKLKNIPNDGDMFETIYHDYWIYLGQEKWFLCNKELSDLFKSYVKQNRTVILVGRDVSNAISDIYHVMKTIGVNVEYNAEYNYTLNGTQFDIEETNESLQIPYHYDIHNGTNDGYIIGFEDDDNNLYLFKALYTNNTLNEIVISYNLVNNFTDYILLNNNKQYKIISTVINILKDILKINSNINSIIIEPTNIKLFNFYKRYLSEFPLWKTKINNKFIKLTKQINESLITESHIKNLKVYHGTNNKFNEFDLDKSYDGGIWFTDNIDTIKNHMTGGTGNKYIMTRYITLTNPGGWDEYDKYSIDELINMGYDGVELPDGNSTDYIVFYNSSINESMIMESNIKFTEETHNYQHRQYDISMSMLVDDKLVAKADYSLFEGKITIKMIEAFVKGHGYGKMVMRELAKRYGYENIERQQLTPDGVKMRHILDKEYAFDYKQHIDNQNKHFSPDVIDSVRKKYPMIADFMSEMILFGYSNAWAKYKNKIVEFEKTNNNIDFNDISDITKWIKNSATNDNDPMEKIPDFIKDYLNKLL